MERRSFLKKAGLGVAAAGAATVTAPVIAQDGPTVRWRMATSFPRNLPALYGAATRFSEYVNKMTDGKFQIDVFPAGEIVPAFEVLDAVSNGTVQCLSLIHI